MTSNGLRMFLIFYVFGFFIITITYKSAMVSYSAIPVVPSPIGIIYINNLINNLNELISLDTFEKLAHSSLIIETYKKSGMGLDRGLSPTFDLLVDRYFEIADTQNPDGALTRVKEGKIARLDDYQILNYEISHVLLSDLRVN